MKPFNIGILGWNPELSVRGFRQFLENNTEQIRNVSSVRLAARLKDGTTIEVIRSTEDYFLRGRRIDQLMLFDDNRWEILDRRNWDIERIREYTMTNSIVPEEFQIIYYEDIG